MSIWWVKRLGWSLTLMKRLNLRYVHIQKRAELYNIWDLLRDLEGGKLSDRD